MQFEYDIFISYCKKDNKPLDGSKGWVFHFQRYLEIRLTQLLKQKPKFLFYANDEKPLDSELLKSCILIPVVSPDYILDRESIEDIDVFFNEAEKNQNLKIKGRERVFKVVKFPVGFDYLPTRIKNYLGYDLYYQNPASGESQEINTFFGSDAEKTFWMRLDDLAHDIYDVLKEVSIQRTLKEKKSNAVYLAETGRDLTLERDLIKRELQRHGYKVLPDQELPNNVREMESVVKKDLKQCRLSIHLIGGSYGDIPEGSEKSIVDIQNQISAEYRAQVGVVPGAGASVFNRLIWVSPSAKIVNEKQKLFIENLQRDAESINGAEVIQSSIEDLKNIIHKELAVENDEEQSEDINKNITVPSVYLIYDSPDKDGGKEIAEYISTRGVEVYQPMFEGGLLDVRNSHFENLKKCDVALIYYGKAREQWVQMKVLDVLKAPGLGRTKPIQAKAVLVEKGPILNKDKFRSYDISIIENNDGIAISLEPLIAKIKK